MKVCLPFCDVTLALGGWGGGRRVCQRHSRPRCVARSTISLQGSQIRSQRWLCDPQTTGGPGHHPPPPLLPKSHNVREAALVSWGPGPRGGTSWIGQWSLPVLILYRGDKRAVDQSPISQHSLFPAYLNPGRSML